MCCGIRMVLKNHLYIRKKKKDRKEVTMRKNLSEFTLHELLGMLKDCREAISKGLAYPYSEKRIITAIAIKQL